MYKRYMVFIWTLYDNVEPFQCIAGHADNLSEAEKILDDMIGDVDEDGPFGCIFDRINGIVVEPVH